MEKTDPECLVLTLHEYISRLIGFLMIYNVSVQQSDSGKNQRELESRQYIIVQTNKILSF